MIITEEEPDPLPVYMDWRGRTRPIRGKHADRWPHPRFIRVDGKLFVEVPFPSRCGWGMTFHRVQRRRTPIGVFLSHYWEGRSSGFPFGPVVIYSAKWALFPRLMRRAARARSQRWADIAAHIAEIAAPSQT